MTPEDKDTTSRWCPRCGHARHLPSPCRQTYRDETNCGCAGKYEDDPEHPQEEPECGSEELD